MIKLDTTELRRFTNNVLPEYRSQIPFAMAGALNDTMYAVATGLRAEMTAKFDRPTPYIVKSLRYQKASKYDLRFTVYAEEFSHGGLSPAEVLTPEITGGSRPMKRSEARIGSYWVPGSGARLNRYGNIAGSELSTILSALGASSDPMQNRTALSVHRAQAAGRYRVFFRQGAVIYERKARGIVPVLVLIGAPHYAPRISFEATAERIVETDFSPAFEQRLEQAISTMRK